MRIYVAGSAGDRTRLRNIAKRLNGYDDVNVVARWLFDDGIFGGPPEKAALADFEDVCRAGAIVVFTDFPSTSGGFHFEAGLAYGFWSKNHASVPSPRLIVVGAQQSIFWLLPGVIRVADENELLDKLTELVG